MAQYQYVLILMDFMDKKGEKALQALAGFYSWSVQNLKGDKCTNAIATTFSHDLSGRNDEWMEPRSSGPGYYEYWQKEMNTPEHEKHKKIYK